MDSFPWITCETSPGGNTLTYHESPTCNSNTAFDVNCRPSFVTFVGKRSKTVLLDALLGDEFSIPVHKEVYLWSSTRLRSGRDPLVIIDCGAQFSNSTAAVRSMGPSTSWVVSKSTNINAVLCEQVFAPFSSVVCCFVSDLGGPKGVASWLADQATAQTNLPAKPRVLLVTETRSDTFDESIAAKKAVDHLCQAMFDTGKHLDLHEVQRVVERQFGGIEVLGLHSLQPTSVRAGAFKRRLLAMSEASMLERANNFTQFSFTHFQALSKLALHHIDSDTATSFNFVCASRPRGFSNDLLECCLIDFLNALPAQTWLWDFAAPLIASALLLSSYPPHAHSFAPSYLFKELYAASCKAAISSYIKDETLQSKFLSVILVEFQALFVTYRSGMMTASQLHSQMLRIHHPNLACLKSHRSCFCCFMRMPEKVLACGHALCDSCIKIFGQRSPSERHTYDLPECVLCGVNYQHTLFRFVPPTAGIRILSVDGGGIRGIVPLTHLQHLEKCLAWLGCPVKDYFDFVCGTSAGKMPYRQSLPRANSEEGGLVVIGQTFGKRKAMLARVLQLAVAYIQDGQYSLSGIQNAFKETFNTSLLMFNPLQNDTKVAVTTTAVSDSLPWLFSNYNGGKRPDDLGYDVVRADKPQNDITVSDAACCTSAAPWFFKPQAVRSLGNFQDGGLHHNNPAGITQCEARFIWPNKDNPDIFLSLGTGTASVSTELGMLAKPRFYMRLFKTLMRSMDGEDAWRRFVNSLAPNVRHRYHRLNVQFAGPEPSLDDALQIPDLKNNVLEKLKDDRDCIEAVVDAIIASLFYFELDELPKCQGGEYVCSGYVFCRLNIPKVSLRKLYVLLGSSWFLVQGSPVRCVESVPHGLPPFKKRVTFRVNALDDLITFSIRGITSTAKPLSGFPTTLAKLVSDQMLDCPFGTVDHWKREKPLPAVPKRRRTSQPGCDKHSKRVRSDCNI